MQHIITATLFLILLKKKYCVKVHRNMMFSTSPSITRSTSVPGMIPANDRPPFVTFNKETGFYISPEKEQRFQVDFSWLCWDTTQRNSSPHADLAKLFQEWKKKNERRMKELNVRPRVFEYVSKPTVVQQRYISVRR